MFLSCQVYDRADFANDMSTEPQMYQGFGQQYAMPMHQGQLRNAPPPSQYGHQPYAKGHEAPGTHIAVTMIDVHKLTTICSWF